MGYRLAMSAEIHDWLTDLGASDPLTARLVGEGLTALIAGGVSLGPPMVISLAGSSRQADLTDVLDQSYQRRLERMQILRRAVAEATNLVSDARLQIAELESRQAELGDSGRRALEDGQAELGAAAATELAAARDQAAELARLLPAMIEDERKLIDKSQRSQPLTDAFRTRKDTLRARHTAAGVELAIAEAAAALGQATGDQGEPGEDLDASVTAAADRLRDTTGEIEAELHGSPLAEDLSDLRRSAGLMELRPGAPADRDVRILFGIEPAGTALLIAILEGSDAVRDNYDEAVGLASGLLREARAGQDPGAAAHRFGAARAFLDEFFGDGAADGGAGPANLRI
jgi:phage shock protein A